MKIPSNITLLEGDCLQTLKGIPDRSVQVCVTSPPYYALRDYGVAGQLGLEDTPEEYVRKLVEIFCEVHRVLKDDGTLWLNLGDSYAGSGGAGGDYYKGGMKEGQPKYKGTARTIRKSFRRDGAEVSPGRTKGYEGLKPKDMIGIPWMVAFALRAEGWYLRSDIIWHKPNPMPESVTDRPTKSHEHIFLFAKSQKYYYDADAISEPSNEWEITKENRQQRLDASGGALSGGVGDGTGKHTTRNKRDVWTVTTKPYPEAHFATFPPDLIEPCILAGSKPGDVVLDPFNGAGTTGVVAIKHHRAYVGCELNPEYLELTRKRFLQVQPTLL